MPDVKKIILAFICLLIIIPRSYSSSNYSEYYFRNMSVEDGLSQNMVYSIMQDKIGHIWFGTIDGLNRYDGLSFKVFKKDSQNESSICSNKILSLLQVEGGNIWIGTANGICIYNPEYESFSSFDIPSDDGVGMGDMVRDLKTDKKGNIWIAVQKKGVYCYTPENKIIAYKVENANIRKLEVDNEGNVWVATYGDGLLRIDPVKLVIKKYLIDKNRDNITENDVNAVLSLNSNALLVGTISRGILKFDKEKEIFTPFIETSFEEKPVFVRCMIKTNNQKLWIGSEEGIFIYDFKTSKIQNLKHIHNNPYALADNAIHSLFQDREGGVWVGTFFGGVSYYNSSFSYFEKYFPITGVNSISGKSISEFCEDDSGNIWIGTEDAGLNYFNLVSKTFNQCSIKSKNIHSLMYNEKKLWVGTFSDWLPVLDLITHEIKSYNNSSSINSIKDDNIYSIYRDSSKRIWIGSLTGLQYYDVNSDSFIRVRDDLIKSQVNDIIEDQNGILWFATISTGIFSYDRFSDEWQHYPSVVGNEDYTGKSAISLLLDKKNRLWVGTEGAGLAVYNRLSDKFDVLANSNSGLPNDVIYKLIEDLRGNIWGSTNKGIFSLNPDNMDIKIFTHKNGLLGDQFNYKSGYIGHDGKIYFGGVKGFIVFDPENLIVNDFVPPVILSRFQIQNKDVTINDDKSPLRKSITFTDNITLSYNNSVFSIAYSVLSYTYPYGNQYAYKLEGRDDEWIYTDQSQQVNYSDLSPGNYIFRVKGSNSNGVWNDEGVSLKIKIRPPWYRTFAAYFAYVFIFSLILYYSISKYINNTKKRHILILNELENRKEKELYSAKIDFFTHITHEIRTPLSLIKIPLDDLMLKISNNNPFKENLTVIQRNVNRMLNLVNELMDFRKTETEGLNLNFIRTDIVEIIMETIYRFKPSIDLKMITLDTSFSVEKLYADVDREVFTKILGNLFSNALKHSKSKINLVFSHNELNFNLEISNDGDEIQDQYVEKIFEPFFKLNNNTQGSGIGLAFIKILVDLHKGSIYCDNSNVGVTKFVVNMPVNQNYRVVINNMEDGITNDFNEHNDVSIKEKLDSVKSKPTILTVEDNEEFQQLLYKHLRLRYDVLQANNGKEASDIMDGKSVDLVICDIMMPIMDGLEFCKKVKEDIKVSHIPVILLTAKTNIESKIEGLNLGADEYIEKPFSMEFLTARIDNLLINRKKIIEAFKRSPELAYHSITYSKGDEDFLQKLIELIHENLTDPNLNIDKLSEDMAVSRATLYRKVRNVSELSPNEFILLIRLKKAAELLKQNKYQINEIAFMVGFNSANYFSKCFYKQFGILPKDF